MIFNLIYTEVVRLRKPFHTHQIKTVTGTAESQPLVLLPWIPHVLADVVT